MPLPIIAAAGALIGKAGKIVGKGVKAINAKRQAQGKGKMLSGLFKGKKKKVQEAAEKKLQEATETVQPNALTDELKNPKDEQGAAAPNANEFIKKYGLFIGGGFFLFMMMMMMMSRGK